jgi:hypothetical protein
MTTYDIGDQVRISGSFTNLAGTATDPTALKIAIRTPNGAETVSTYGSDVAVVKDATGEYHFDVLLTEGGPWYYRWRATGAVTAAEEGFVKVRESEFTNPLP